MDYKSIYRMISGDDNCELSKAIIYRELVYSEYFADLSEKDIDVIVELAYETYLETDYGTLVGAGVAVSDYVTSIFEKNEYFSTGEFVQGFKDAYAESEWK